MDKPKKIYWKGVEQLKNDPSFVKNNEKEFPSDLPIKDTYGDNEDAIGATRRDFLKTMGFGVAAVSLAACESPVRKAIPYINKPEDVDPSIPNYYASTFADGSDYCPIVVKTREGRPIFIQGNNLSTYSKGGTTVRANAAILSLYDEEREKSPSKNKSSIDWKTADSEIKTALEKVNAQGNAIRIVSNSILSPSTRKLINEFGQKFQNFKHVTYDKQSYYGIVKANQTYFGKKVVPSYSFDKAKVVVSFNADFLGGWISQVEHTRQFAPTRKVGKEKKDMSKLYVMESMMSITGASADYRKPIKPSQEGQLIGLLHDELAGSLGKSQGGFKTDAPEVLKATIKRAAKDLLSNKGKSLVVSGSNDPNIQLIANAINDMLSNYGNTIHLDKPSYLKQGNDEEMKAFAEELVAGSVGAVIFYNANPVYDHPLGSKIKQGLTKAQLTVSTADRLHETASETLYNCPDSHFLESWNDAQPRSDYFSLCQPTISTIFNTRQVQDSLIAWGGLDGDYLSRLKNYWETTLFPQSGKVSFEKFWVESLHNGDFVAKNHIKSEDEEATLVTPEKTQVDDSEGQQSGSDIASSSSFSISSIASAIKSEYESAEELELVIYSSPILGSGTQSNNPILQETPDSITKVCWGNFVAVAQSYATEKGYTAFETNVSETKLSVGEKEGNLPVISQPGLAKGVVAIPLGYGRSESVGKVAAGEKGANGINAYQFASYTSSGTVSYNVLKGVGLTPTGKTVQIAQTQTHNTIMGRESIIQETTLSEYKENPKAGRYIPKIETYSGKTQPTNISVWDIAKDGYEEDARKSAEKRKEAKLWFDRVGTGADKHVYPNHHWGLAIDLNSCTGCSACVVACHLENNVPVVGKEEVVRRREMHWLRIDRYYSNEADVDETNYSEMEIAAENPEVVFQPMMCQHCNNAPCETVCPVVATTHSSEGLNQMTYNRCVGTKYCANNCPYKVRRFNWFRYHSNDMFDYYMNDKLGKMVLNPDVTVRSRGVMEKCSMCVQRIQYGKLQAKIEKRKLKDGEITTACASACPTNAIVFGDLNDGESGIRQLMETEIDERAYNVLDEINVSPNVWYLTKVRNKDQDKA